jgi:hypothetical protein
MSSPTKILDNAIVGYCVKYGLNSENTRRQKAKRAKYQALVRRAKELGIEAEATKRADAILSHKGEG